jgi:hypothetical protein
VSWNKKGEKCMDRLKIGMDISKQSFLLPIFGMGIYRLHSQCHAVKPDIIVSQFGVDKRA